jgi:hypothetical protein
MVFRAEGEFDRVAANGGSDEASDGWSGDAALAVVEAVFDLVFSLEASGITPLSSTATLSQWALGGLRAEQISSGFPSHAPGWLVPPPPIKMEHAEKKAVTGRAFRKPLILQGMGYGKFNSFGRRNVTRAPRNEKRELVAPAVHSFIQG